MTYSLPFNSLMFQKCQWKSGPLILLRGWGRCCPLGGMFWWRLFCSMATYKKNMLTCLGFTLCVQRQLGVRYFISPPEITALVLNQVCSCCGMWNYLSGKSFGILRSGLQKPLPAPLQRSVTAHFLWQPLSTTCAQTEGLQPKTSPPSTHPHSMTSHFVPCLYLHKKNIVLYHHV